MDIQNVPTPEGIMPEESPKSKLGLFALIGVVLVTAIAGGVYYFGFSSPTPPSLGTEGGLQGYIAGKASGVPYAEKADVDAYKVPAGLERKTPVEMTTTREQFTYSYQEEAGMNLAKTLDAIPPVEKQAAMVATYDPTLEKFITTTQKKWTKNAKVNLTEDVKQGQAFVVFSTAKTLKAHLPLASMEPTRGKDAKISDLKKGWNLVSFSKLTFENVYKNFNYDSFYMLDENQTFVEVPRNFDSKNLKNYIFWVLFPETPALKTVTEPAVRTGAEEPVVGKEEPTVGKEDKIIEDSLSVVTLSQDESVLLTVSNERNLQFDALKIVYGKKGDVRPGTATASVQSANKVISADTNISGIISKNQIQITVKNLENGVLYEFTVTGIYSEGTGTPVVKEETPKKPAEDSIGEIKVGTAWGEQGGEEENLLFVNWLGVKDATYVVTIDGKQNAVDSTEATYTNPSVGAKITVDAKNAEGKNIATGETIVPAKPAKVATEVKEPNFSVKVASDTAVSGTAVSGDKKVSFATFEFNSDENVTVTEITLEKLGVNLGFTELAVINATIPSAEVSNPKFPLTLSVNVFVEKNISNKIKIIADIPDSAEDAQVYAIKLSGVKFSYGETTTTISDLNLQGNQITIGEEATDATQDQPTETTGESLPDATLPTKTLDLTKPDLELKENLAPVDSTIDNTTRILDIDARLPITRPYVLPAPDLSVNCDTKNVCSLVIETLQFQDYAPAANEEQTPVITGFKITVGTKYTILNENDSALTGVLEGYAYKLDDTIDLTKPQTFKVQVLVGAEASESKSYSYVPAIAGLGIEASASGTADANIKLTWQDSGATGTKATYNIIEIRRNCPNNTPTCVSSDFEINKTSNLKTITFSNIYKSTSYTLNKYFEEKIMISRCEGDICTPASSPVYYHPALDLKFSGNTLSWNHMDEDASKITGYVANFKRLTCDYPEGKGPDGDVGYGLEQTCPTILSTTSKKLTKDLSSATIKDIISSVHTIGSTEKYEISIKKEYANLYTDVTLDSNKVTVTVTDSTVASLNYAFASLFDDMIDSLFNLFK